jgi:hypothetical protein
LRLLIEAAGFNVTVQEERNLQGIRKRLGIPADLAAGHTAEASGYVIEGHVQQQPSNAC